MHPFSSIFVLYLYFSLIVISCSKDSHKTLPSQDPELALPSQDSNKAPASEVDNSGFPLEQFKYLFVGLDKDILSLHSEPVSFVLLYKDGDKSNGVRIGIEPGELLDIGAMLPYSLEVSFAFLNSKTGSYRTFSTSYGKCKDIQITEKTQTPLLVNLDSVCEAADPTNPRMSIRKD